MKTGQTRPSFSSVQTLETVIICFHYKKTVAKVYFVSRTKVVQGIGFGAEASILTLPFILLYAFGHSPSLIFGIH